MTQFPAGQNLQRRDLHRQMEMPCIRCGACAEVCPAQLQPQELLRQLRSDDLASAASGRLLDCSECGRCDPVCPSSIPLLQTFHEGKQELHRRARQLATADHARERYQNRQRRLQRDAAEAETRLAERKAQVAGADAVSAALSRAQARRATKDRDSNS